MSGGNYIQPCGVGQDTAGRQLDAAGKLVQQTARPDLKKTGYIDPDRQPTFITQEILP